jgi:hypothetical protein
LITPVADQARQEKILAALQLPLLGQRAAAATPQHRVILALTAGDIPKLACVELQCPHGLVQVQQQQQNLLLLLLHPTAGVH